MINEVMLASVFKPEKAFFPLYATPKIDGIRFYIEHGHVWTRQSKPLVNLSTQRVLPGILPNGIDGEAVCGTFNGTQSFFMSNDKELCDFPTEFFLFDLVGSPDSPHSDRIVQLHRLFKGLVAKGWTKTSNPGDLVSSYRHPSSPITLRPLLPFAVTSLEQLERFYERCLLAGFEGIILREPSSPYEFGRSKLMLKYKPVVDREAVILGVEEQLTNINPPQINELGRMFRSSAKAGLVPNGKLGSFQVRDLESEVVFHVGNGKGLTESLRRELWDRRHTLVGQVIEYQSMPYGVKELPRHPQFLCIKSERAL